MPHTFYLFTDTAHEKNTYCPGVYSEKHTKHSSISDASKTEYISLHYYMTLQTALLIFDRKHYPLLGK